MSTNPQIQKIHAAADTLAAVTNGRRPTLAAIRAELGGGSFTTISEAMKTWAGPKLGPADSDSTPEAILRAGDELAAALWRQARELAEDQLRVERAALDAVRAELERQTTEAVALVDDLTIQNAGLAAKIDQLTRDADVQKESFSAMASRAAAAEAALCESRERVLQVESQLARAEQRADEAASLAGRAREEAAELRGRLVPAHKSSKS